MTRDRDAALPCQLAPASPSRVSSPVVNTVSAPIASHAERISSAHELAAVTADLAFAICTSPPDAARRLHPLFLLLAECQAELLRPDASIAVTAPIEQPTTREANAERVALLLRQLQDVSGPGERAAIVVQRTGWSLSTFYRSRADALQLGLLP